MSRFFLLSIAIALIVATLSSCAPKLVGTWNVVRYENTEPGQPASVMTNIGTMTFRKNGDGEKNLSYDLFGRSRIDNTRFGWHSTGPYIGIESPGSEFSKTWIIVTNKRKEQKWKSTDGASRIQVLELKK